VLAGRPLGRLRTASCPGGLLFQYSISLVHSMITNMLGCVCGMCEAMLQRRGGLDPKMIEGLERAFSNRGVIR